MTAGELALVVVAVLCVLAFAALAVTLMRMRDALGELRAEVVSLRTTTHEAAAATAAHLAEARHDLDRFDRIVGSAESISDAVDRSGRAARAALSTPAIKAAGIATGTSRAVRRLRSSS